MSELHKLAEELGLEEVVYESWTDLLGRPLDLDELKWVTLWRGHV